MIDRLAVLNGERQQEAIRAGQPFLPFRIGIGLNTGRCVVGNLGSDLRFNYSVLGDPVNVASRLEGQTKFYRVPIIIGSKTAERAKDQFAILEIDLVAVKGKTEPDTIYALLGREEMAHDLRFQELRKLPARGLGGDFCRGDEIGFRGRNASISRARQGPLAPGRASHPHQRSACCANCDWRHDAGCLEQPAFYITGERLRAPTTSVLGRRQHTAGT
jgi:hypothetical protein